MKISGFSNHKYNNKVSYACKQRKKRVEDTCYNICNEDFFRAIKVKLIFKEETVLFCIVHGEQSVLPESRSQLEPDEFKPVFLYLVPFHGVSVRIRLFFPCFFLPSDAHIPTKTLFTSKKKHTQIDSTDQTHFNISLIYNIALV